MAYYRPKVTPHDPIIDVKEKRLMLEEIIEYIFQTDTVKYMKGKENIKYDMIMDNCYQKGYSIPCELKTRWSNYKDIAVEITQYQNISDGYISRLHEGFKKEEILKYLEKSKGAGWLFHTKAKVILYITQDHIDVINFPMMKDYMYNNFNSLQDKYCGKTTGAYNKIIPYNRDTRDFIKRYDSNQIQILLKEFYGAK